MPNTVNQRLDFFRKSLHINKTELATELKTSQPAISAILSGKRPLSRGMIARIKQLHPELNVIWLETGLGDMVITQRDGIVYQSTNQGGDNYNHSLVMPQQTDEIDVEIVELNENSSPKDLMSEIHRLKALLFDRDEEIKKVKNELAKAKKQLKAKKK